MNNSKIKIYSPLRYPGGKAFLAQKIGNLLDKIDTEKLIYVEPYGGGAGAALTLLFSGRVKRIVINDFDKSIFSFWKSVTEHSKKFSKKILSTPATISEWKKQKKIYNNKNSNTFDLGFATFFLNRTNRSGIMRAGPIGGIKQKGNYKLYVRYNREELSKRVKRIGKFKNRIIVTNEDGIKLARKYFKKKDTFIYLDPPYYKKGALLYLNHYKNSDHVELAALLNSNADKKWVLTYDITKEIKNLYSKRARKRFDLTYSVYDSSNIHKARELMFVSDPISRLF